MKHGDLYKMQSVQAMAAESGMGSSAPMSRLAELVGETRAKGRAVHFLPPYRHDTQIQIMDLLGSHTGPNTMGIFFVGTQR